MRSGGIVTVKDMNLELGTWNLEVAEMRTNLHSESDAHSPQGNVSAKDRLNIIQRSRGAAQQQHSKE
jgi:hypothetical protein